MPRFVLLRHEMPAGGEKPSHWDFMLEEGGALATWNLAELPAEWASALSPPSTGGNVVVAEQINNHRIAYLDYEGPVSGDRGGVVRCDGGEYEALHVSETRRQVRLAGEHCHGVVDLRRTGADSWTLASVAGHGEE